MYEGIRELTTGDRPKFDKVAEFASHCFGLRDANGLVPAARFAPGNIPKLAPQLTIVGVLDDGKDYVVRLVGTKVANELFDVDHTGFRLSHALGDDVASRRIWHIADMALRSKKPVLNQPGRTRLPGKDFLLLETVTFPLVDDADAVTKLVTFYDFRFDSEALP